MKVIKQIKMEICRNCADEGDEDSCDHQKEDRKYVLIVPDCCSTAQEACYPCVMVGVEKEEHYNDPSKWIAKWRLPNVNLDYEIRHIFSSNPYKRFDICACPFCGATLPEIVLEDVLPDPLCFVDDCGHCDCGWPRRYGQCACWPREAAFKTK